MDVFLCTRAQDDIRRGLRDAVVARWRQMPVTLHILDGCSHDGKAFQGLRRTWAERDSIGDYILAEDDCMPLGRDFTERGMALLLSRPEYAVISPVVLNGLYAGPQYEDDGNLIRANTVGGINFTRKGVIIPPTSFCDEAMQGQQLADMGWKCGYAKDLLMNHLGAMLSTIWPDDYASGQTQP